MKIISGNAALGLSLLAGIVMSILLCKVVLQPVVWVALMALGLPWFYRNVVAKTHQNSFLRSTLMLGVACLMTGLMLLF